MTILKISPGKLLSLRLLWKAISVRRRSQLLALQLLSIAAAAGEVANLGALLPFLHLLANPSEALKSLGPLSIPLRQIPEDYLLFGLGTGFMFMVAVSTVLRVYTVRNQLRLAALITADFGEQIFSAVLSRPYAWHLQHNSSMVLAYLTKDVDQLAGIIQTFLLAVVNFAIVILLGGSLIALAPRVMLMVILLLGIFYLLVFHFSRGTLRSDGQLITANHQASLQVAQEALGGIRDVLLDRSQNFFMKAYQDCNRSARLAMAGINIKAQVPRYFIEGFAVLLITSLSLILAISGEGIEKQIPILGTLILGAYRLLQPLQQCFNAISNLQANQSSLLRLSPFLQLSVETIKRPAKPYAVASLDIVSPTRLEKHNSPLVELKSVNFRYHSNGNWVLQDINLSIEHGEKIGIVGTTGSGKSTMSDLILGLIQPTKGNIFVFGKDLFLMPNLLEIWHGKVAHVPQHIYLSDSSFAANIAFGVSAESIDNSRVRYAAQKACISTLIEASPHGYDTLVGERGVRLSGGQRQRIGIARAFYKNADLLVLDEATSALDNRTESEVTQAIDGLSDDLSLIVIAHRLSTLRNCDRIIVIENGIITGNDSFHNLETKHSAFQRLSNNYSDI
jgi:ABC-type multidrug transport system fused ATPase/permease subunit